PQESLGIERTRVARIQRAAALVDLDAQPQQPLDMRQQLPAHALLVALGQARECRHCEFDCLGHLWLIPVTVLPRMRRDAIFLPAPRNHPDESSVGVTGREATSAWGQTGKFVAVSCRYRRAARWCAATRPFVRASAS